MKELSNMIELTEKAIFEKEKETDIVNNVDLFAFVCCLMNRYLDRVSENCTKLSAETVQEEMEYLNQKEEMKCILNSLETKKQLCWVMEL